MTLCDRIANGECPFGLLKEGQTMAECPSGFPGCGCMDELMAEESTLDLRWAEGHELK
jgi:hypothetical protein